MGRIKAKKGTVLFSWSALILFFLVFWGLSTFPKKPAARKGELFVNGVWTINVDVKVRKVAVLSSGVTSSDENEVNKEYDYHAELPLTRVLNGLGFNIKWLDDSTAEIYRIKKYILDLEKLSFVEKGKGENFILPVAEKGRACRVLKRELVLGEDTVRELLSGLGEEVEIDIDYQKARVSIFTYEDETDGIEFAGQDEDGNRLYNLHVGGKRYEGLFRLASCKGKSMIAEVYGKAWRDEYTPVIAVRSKGKLSLFEWERCDLYPPDIFLADIDGDGGDEIIYHNPIFYGQHPVHILKVEGNKLVELYRFPQYEYNSELDLTEIRDTVGTESLNFGFVGRLSDGYKLILKFPALGFKREVDLSDGKYFFIDKSRYFDESGKPFKEYVREVEPYLSELECDYFYPIFLYDAHGDGAVELMGRQSIEFEYKQTVGFVDITLKFNAKSKKMEVIEVEFEEIGPLEVEGSS